MNRENYVLWLPSWYPNEWEPYNGDFIQRHAEAAALNNNITVIFFTQYGEKMAMDHKVTETVTGNLKEVIVYLPFKPSRFELADRVRYNLFFYQYSKRFLQEYFRKNGLPFLAHVHVPVKSGNLALWLKRKFGVPYLVSEHASTYLRTAPENFFRRHLIYRLQVKKIFAQAAMVTNVSLTIGELLMQLFPIKKLRVIHNVVNTDVFYPASVKKNNFIYIHVSSLTEQKNVFGILRVFQKLASIRKDWSLFIIGPYSEEIVRHIKMAQLDGLVHLTGEVSYEKVAVYMRQAHVLVLFSKHENFPCVVVEALCCGLPVVSSDIAGIKEAVNDSNGILVQSEDEDALLEALVKVRNEYGVYNPIAIATNAASRFSYAAIAKKFDELYRHQNAQD